MTGALIGWWSLALAAIFMIGVTKSGFGSGVGLMIVPMTALAMTHIPGRGPAAALGLLLPLLIAGDLLALWQYRELFAAAGKLNIIWRLLPGTIAGVALGSLLLWLLHELGRTHEALAAAVIRIDIGLESVVLVGLHWWRVSRGRHGIYVPKMWHSHLVGGASAVSSTMAHAAGPIIALYLLPQEIDRQLFVGGCAVYFFLLNTAKLPAYAMTHQFANASPAFALRFLPVVLAGAAFGFWLNRRMNDRLFSKVLYAITFALGWYILGDGVRGVAGNL